MRPRPSTLAAAIVAASTVAAAGPVAATSEPPPPITVPVVDAAAFDPESRVDAARAGLAGYLGGFSQLADEPGEEVDLEACPLLSAEEVGVALAPLGDGADLEEIEAAIQVEQPREGDDPPDPAAFAHPVVCEASGGAADGAHIVGFGVAAVDYSAVMLDELLAAATEQGAAVIATPSAATFGGTTFGLCERYGDDHQCVVLWAHDTLVLGILATFAASPPPVGDLNDVFVGLLPQLLDRLATDLRSPGD